MKLQGMEKNLIHQDVISSKDKKEIISYIKMHNRLC